MSGRPPAYDYVKDPGEIYRRSFSIVRGEAALAHLPAALHSAAVRIVHACGDPSVTRHLAWSEGVEQAVANALRAGAPVFTDVRMVAEGIIASRLPAGNEIRCPPEHPTWCICKWATADWIRGETCNEQINIDCAASDICATEQGLFFSYNDFDVDLHPAHVCVEQKCAAQWAACERANPAYSKHHQPDGGGH